MDNTFMDRIDNRTPVKRLYLSGAWGNLGGGEFAFEKITEGWG